MIFTYENFYSEFQRIKIIKFDEFVERGKESIYKQHKLDFYGIILIQEGVLIHKIGVEVHEISAGEILFIGPGQLHSFEKTEGVKGLVISFPEDFLLTSNDQGNVINFRFLYILSSKNILTSNLKDGQAIERLCEVLYSESRNSFDQFQHHILQNTLFSLIYLLMRSYSETKNMNQPNDSTIILPCILN